MAAVLSTMYLYDKLGRKKMIIISILSGGLPFIITVFYQTFIAIAVQGKFFVIISAEAMYSSSVELFLKIRGEAMGFLNIFSRKGSAGSTFISKALSETQKSAPFFAIRIIGVGCLLPVVCTLRNKAPRAFA